jgi:hypothetical protein
MSKGKWGESFLKSGLPLEHLTQVTLQTLGWSTNPHVQYARNNAEDRETWFELDLESTYPEPNRDTLLSLLIECKYHDLSRFWFFLPHEAKGWYMDDSFLNCGPLQTLKDPQARAFLNLAPTSTGGIVVSADGAKQDNSVYTAVQQLVNGFVPFSLSNMFSFNLEVIEGYDPMVTAVIPMIVTNASIYRLRPDITDLETIREASSPLDIAHELDWTWYFYDAPFVLFSQNMVAIDLHKETEAELVYRYPFVKERMQTFGGRPHWIAIVNIKSLPKVIDTLKTQFFAMETLEVSKVMQPKRASRKSRK